MLIQAEETWFRAIFNEIVSSPQCCINFKCISSIGKTFELPIGGFSESYKVLLPDNRARNLAVDNVAFPVTRGNVRRKPWSEFSCDAGVMAMSSPTTKLKSHWMNSITILTVRYRTIRGSTVVLKSTHSRSLWRICSLVLHKPTGKTHTNTNFYYFFGLVVGSNLSRLNSWYWVLLLIVSKGAPTNALT